MAQFLFNLGEAFIYFAQTWIFSINIAVKITAHTILCRNIKATTFKQPNYKQNTIVAENGRQHAN